jgi:hypothetical protein
VLDRIMEALIRKARKTPKGLVFDMDEMPMVLRQQIEDSNGRPLDLMKLGTFNVPAYVTGKVVKVPVVLTQGARVAGRAAIRLMGERRLSLAERKRRVTTALQKLGITVSPAKFAQLTDLIFAWNAGVEVYIDIPRKPLNGDDLRQVRAILAHELTHVADEAASLGRQRESEKSDALSDIDLITEELKLPGYVPKRGEDVEPSPRDGPEWANDRNEVTAMISEIMEEIGNFTETIKLFRLDRVLHGRRPFPSRERELIAFFRWASPTFTQVSPEWEPKNLNRVLRALWDRYHAEPGFPRATGVHRNRRTSRRRTSRRAYV